MSTDPVSFDTSPDRYRHWRLDVDGDIATLTMAVDENGGLVDGYELKLNSYDLGVDVELYDAVQRLRFEHPEVRAVVLTSGKDKVFSAGANIRMLAASPHEWKVNFCKFTNETRNGIEDATAHSGQTWVAAVNGTASGGGYELALACERIVLVDDGSSAVSLPEAPLLGVLPGTGGLTRLTDKRHVRRDLADVFTTKAEGVRGQTAVDWRLVDEVVKPNQLDARVRDVAREASARSHRRGDTGGVALTPLRREESDDGLAYRYVTARYDRDAGTVDVTVRGPERDATGSPQQAHDEGADWWPLAVTRELDDLVLRLRTNETELGTWLLRTRGDAGRVLAYDRVLAENGDDWLVNEVRHYLKRTLKRLDVTSRTLFALVEPGSCFAGSLLELALASDRTYMLDGVFEDDDRADEADDRADDAQGADVPATLTLGPLNLGPLPMGNGLTRLATRFLDDHDHLALLEKHQGEPLDAVEAFSLGLVTSTPDDLDWEDEIRLAVEERTSFSPDVLVGLEANNRFAGPETMETKIFGRLSAWQNWIFTRPNASGPEGALRRYGTGQRARFDRKRV